MHNSQQHREQDVRQQVMTSTARNDAQKLAPEVRAARTLLAPDVQQQIAQLAEGIEATLLGNQPAQLTRKRRGRRGISLWIGIPLAGFVSVVIISSAGWVGAVRYYDIAEKNRLIAEQQGELAAAERGMRKELEAWQERVDRAITSQLEVAAEDKRTGRYDQALVLLDMFSEIATAVVGREGELATRLRQQRTDTIVSLISDAYGSDVDVSGVRTALQQLTESEIAGRDASGSTNRD
ncbi:MAG: hypothetical protein IID41_06160 [Planctomycetes bacterium]|nr:hypothetical protein [Planctomycetota bacterium]